MHRRTLLAGAAFGLLGPDKIPGTLTLPGAELGHVLRDGAPPEPTSTTRTDVLIIGAGMAGLSAAWRLRKHGIDDLTLLELQPEPGGNAGSGANAVSAFPWGAHYVPALTRESLHAQELFEDTGLITGRTPSGDPVYDEFALCADPHERLFLLGRWQDDLLPELGVTAEDRRQYRAFFTAMDRYRAAKGRDGRRAFAIPVDLSSTDPAFLALDRLTMSAWMRGQGWDSAPLDWYIDYCCRDDFGTRAAETSAWAGIHYFAARDRSGTDDPPVLTWPDGNGHIVGELRRRLGQIACNALAWRVQPGSGGVAVDVFEPAPNASRRIQAKAAILAVPRFVANRLLSRAPDGVHHYAPWMVANVTLDRMPGGTGAPLAWDNVVYGSPSLGYVVANHQSLERVRRNTVLTYYWPLCDVPPAEARRIAFARSLGAWQAQVADELLRIHPELGGAIQSIDVCVWGHGMIRPAPGLISGAARQAACRQTPPVFFAHSDMSGISLFEEANYRGVLAADAVIEYLG